MELGSPFSQSFQTVTGIRVAQHKGWRGRVRALDRFFNLDHIVTIYTKHIGSKGTKFSLKIPNLANRIHLTVALLAIDVHNCRQIVRFVKDHCLNGFPGLSFLEFSIGHVDHDTTGVSLELSGVRNTGGLAQSLG